jgi:alanine-glyoxylate transaminase/serine-glyoxylate transaminase/serine-pyruvate transaminase
MKGRVFRIGHVGSLNDLTLIGALAGVEMGLALAGVPHQPGGVAAAMAALADTPPRKPAPLPESKTTAPPIAPIHAS